MSKVVVADVNLTLDLNFMLHLVCQPDLDLLCRYGAALLKEGKVGRRGWGHVLLVGVEGWLDQDAS